MNVREPEAFARYLLAKRTVDDRALNRTVYEALRLEARKLRSPVRVLDIGAGVGVGLERVIDWELFEPGQRVVYDLLEPSPDSMRRAQERFESLPAGLELRFRRMSVQELLESDRDGGEWDLVVGHAVLDLLDLGVTLPGIRSLVRPGGLLYVPITFDGLTLFEPAHPDDNEVLEAYHATMDARSGGSRTGRSLFHALSAAGLDVLGLGSSDWVVYPTEGAYPADEAYFLRFIVETIGTELRDELGAPLERWLEARRRQLEEVTLVYVAHQLDALARRPIG